MQIVRKMCFVVANKLLVFNPPSWYCSNENMCMHSMMCNRINVEVHCERNSEYSAYLKIGSKLIF